MDAKLETPIYITLRKMNGLLSVKGFVLARDGSQGVTAKADVEHIEINGSRNVVETAGEVGIIIH